MCCSVISIITRPRGNVKKLDNSLLTDKMETMNCRCMLLLLALLVAGLNSCVCHTSASLMNSCTFRASEREKGVQPKVYRVGEQYYLEHTVTYQCREEKVRIGGMVAVWGSEVCLPFGYEREPRQKTFYFLLSSKDARAYLKTHVPGASPETSRLIAQEDWDAAAAVEVPAPRAAMEVRTEDDPAAYCRYFSADKRFRLCVPSIHSGDVVLKAPLSLLLLGVDIPVSIVSTLIVCTGIPGLLGY